MRRKRSQSVARRGINYVRQTVEECNSVFQEISQDNDLGNDAYIEFVRGEEASAFCIAAQIKSGKSLLRKDYAIIPSDKDHFEYWKNHILPVAGVVYDPVANVGYWTNITLFLREHSDSIENGPYRIPVPYTNRFSADGFETFAQNFMLTRLQGTIEENFGISLRYLANVDNEADCIEAVKLLFFLQRDKGETWFYLIPYISRTKHKSVQRAIVYYLSIMLGNPDFIYGREIKPEASLARYCRMLLSQTLDQASICILLDLLDEDGYRRGSIGQCVRLLLEEIKGIIDILIRIITDESCSDSIRYNALVLHILLSQAHGESVQWETELISRFLQNSRDKFYKSLAIELRETLNNFGGISL